MKQKIKFVEQKEPTKTISRGDYFYTGSDDYMVIYVIAQVGDSILSLVSINSVVEFGKPNRYMNGIKVSDEENISYSEFNAMCGSDHSEFTAIDIVKFVVREK